MGRKLTGKSFGQGQPAWIVQAGVGPYLFQMHYAPFNRKSAILSVYLQALHVMGFFVKPCKMNVFWGILESVCLPIHVSVCICVCVQNTSNFRSQTPTVLL